jgi:hypothetical protein
MRKNISITEFQYEELSKDKVFRQFVSFGIVVGIVRIPVVSNSVTNFLHFCIVEYPDAKA